MRVLAIDDDPIFCDVLKARLSNLDGYAVEIATTGPEALSRVTSSEQPFDCFLVDICMEPMDGIELVERLRSIPRHQFTPILMISTMSDKKSIERAFLAGANDYIIKPLDPVELNIRLSMAKALYLERAQARLLKKHIVKHQDVTLSLFKFNVQTLASDLDCVIPFETLENFVHTQGGLRLRKSSAIGFHLPMADQYFQSLEPVNFFDLICDLTRAVSRSLSDNPHLLAHSGEGDLVAILLDKPRVNAGELQAILDQELMALREHYSKQRIAVPAIRVGPSTGFASSPFDRPKTTIAKALKSARRPGHFGFANNARGVA